MTGIMIEARTEREWIVRLEDGENVIDVLRDLGKMSAVIVAGIGMLRDAELAYWNGHAYETHGHPAPAELVSLQGNLASDEGGNCIVHAHVCLANRDGSVVAGHLVRGTVHNTLEMMMLPLTAIALDRRREDGGLVGLYPRTM
jgi:hypothetical protein